MNYARFYLGKFRRAKPYMWHGEWLALKFLKLLKREKRWKIKWFEHVNFYNDFKLSKTIRNQKFNNDYIEIQYEER